METSKRTTDWVMLLRGKYIRQFLQSLYISLTMSVANAKIFEENLDKPVAGPFHGNKLAKRCALKSFMWLKTIKDFTVSEEVYRNHFQEPVRLLANLRSNMRHTVTIKAFVFSKSPDFYDRYFNCNVQSLGVIVPELGSAMSIRLRSSEAANVKPGSLYTLSYVQPMPYVNRIHPQSTDISTMGGRFSLSKIDSLMTSIGDLELFRSSLAFENFCEIQCHQAGRRLLGAPVIVSGYLEAVDSPFIYVRGCSGNYVKFYINKTHFETNSGIKLGELRSLTGEPVILLVVVWYGKRQVDLHPEVFMLERLEDHYDPFYAEVCGYVRLRAPMHAKDLAMKFSQLGLPSCDSISVKDGTVDWEPRVNMADYREFYIMLRRLRRGHGSGEPEKEMLAHSELLLDETRLKKVRLANRLRTETDLLKTLLKLLMHQDKTGELPRSLTELLKIVYGGAQRTDLLKQHIYWLIYTGLLKRRRRSSVIERWGIHVLLEAIKTGLRRDISGIIHRERIVIIDELARKLDLPPSLLLIGLKSLEKEGVVRCLDACELCWASTELMDSATVVSESESVMAEYEKAVLAVLGEVFHSLHSLKITETLQERGYCISHSTVLKLLEKLKSRNIVVRHPDDMWEYPLPQRIKHFLESHPTSAYTFHQIADHIRVPLHLRSELLKVLEELYGKSVIWQPLDDLWAIKPEDEGSRLLQIRSVLLSKAKTLIVDLLEEKKVPAQDQWLMSKTRMELRPIAEKIGYVADVTDIVNDAISELIAQGTVKVSERLGYRWFSLSRRRDLR